MRFAIHNPQEIIERLSCRRQRELKKDGTLILLYLLHCHRHNEQGADDEELSELLELSVAQTQKCLQRLQQQGLLRKLSPPSQSPHSTGTQSSSMRKHINRKNWGNILSILHMDTTELTPLQWRWFDEIRARLDPNLIPLEDLMSLAIEHNKWESLFSLLAKHLQRSPFSLSNTTSHQP